MIALAPAPGRRRRSPAPVAAPHPRAPRGRWVPAPVCGPGCLPDRHAGPRVGPARFGLRLAGLLLVLVAVAAGEPLLRGPSRERFVRGCAARALRAAGVRLRVHGGTGVSGGPALVVANHLSWIDVLALHATGPVRMQAKHEVATWPVLGALAARTGALFVDRGGLRALPGTVAETAGALRGGDVVVVFPEGTTWCGAAAGTFRRAAFQAALDADVPVRPVAFTLRRPDGTATAGGAFVGDQTLWDSVCRVLRAPGLVCDMTLLPPLSPATGDRRALAAAAAAAVSGITAVPHGGAAVRYRAAEAVPAAA